MDRIYMKNESAIVWLTLWVTAVVIAFIVLYHNCPEWLTKGESGSTTLRNLSFVAIALIGFPVPTLASADRGSSSERCY